MNEKTESQRATSAKSWLGRETVSLEAARGDGGLVRCTVDELLCLTLVDVSDKTSGYLP